VFFQQLDVNFYKVALFLLRIKGLFKKSLF
jgi:hypothetical protein